MRVTLWDTRRNAVQKDYAGGMGTGLYRGRGGLLDWLIGQGYRRDRRPVALNFAYLGGVFHQLGHQVQYVCDRLPPASDLYVFNPALLSLGIEHKMMQELLRARPDARIIVTGPVAYAMPEAFSDLQVKVVRGEAEMLFWKLDEVLADPEQVVSVGSVKDLDRLPHPDWSLFDYRRFRIKYDFWKFPTALVQLSRGCTFTCNYCPYIMVENHTRFRDPECVVEEIRHGVERYGFRSFKFRDPLFGLDRKRVLSMVEKIGSLPFKIQFSIESRIDLMRRETIAALREVGLTSITVGIETPSEETLRRYKRAPIKDDRQREFVHLCRELGIRTVAGFMVGFPEDTEQSILDVLAYARGVNPTYANFNIVTPYPGTEFFNQVKGQIEDFDFSHYSVYEPILKYEHLTRDQVADLHAKCMRGFYFRSRYFSDNAHLLWPALQRFRKTGTSTVVAETVNDSARRAA
ncbi:MAG: radical SAM protein [Pirellulales bacterium]|nr:radical SAM protein [Pirellulales bacterium]